MTEVKICGLTQVDDARAAVDLGADFLGFVLYEGSPRCVAPATVKKILAALPDDARAVGVFVNRSAAEVAAIAADLGLYAAQIHGDEAASEFRDYPARLWRAVVLTETAAAPDPAAWAAERYVVDAAPPGVYGGSGRTTDWPLAAAFAAARPCVLAGGLTPDNVAEAVRVVAPLAVDVSSGVETEPGKKDHRQMQRFIENCGRTRGSVSG